MKLDIIKKIANQEIKYSSFENLYNDEEDFFISKLIIKNLKEYSNYNGYKIVKIFENKSFNNLSDYDVSLLINLRWSFLSCTLSPTLLKDMYGDPICHNLFGKGFKNKDYLSISYLIEINDIKVHIGADYAGTYIQVLNNTSLEDIKMILESIIIKASEVIKTNQNINY